MSSPHCDELVCHAPGNCYMCDTYHVEEQRRRINENIQFTGEPFIISMQGDPAQKRRALRTIHDWPGNRPVAKRLS